jgi:two-component system sensor histidine kinase/response regulator
MPTSQPTANLLLGFPADPVALVADRDPTARGELVALVTAMQVRAVALESAGQLFQQVRSTPPDLVVIATDHGEVDALTVCTDLKGSAATNLIPVLLVGRAGEVDGRQRAYGAGADGWFPRPVQREEFQSRCWALLRQRGLVRALEERRHTYRLRQDFVRFLVHDLRTPLTGAHLGLDLARLKLSDGAPRDQVAAVLDEVAFGLKRVTDMVQDMLDVDRFDRGKLKLEPSRFPVGPLLVDVKHAFEGPCRERAAPLWLEGPAETEVVADRELLERILGNLVANALKYGPPGQPIILDVAEEPRQVRLTVINRGEPLPLADRARIFEPYVRVGAKHQATGAGLGLAFCRLAAEAHGGTIFVEDYPGGGTAFVLVLPR